MKQRKAQRRSSSNTAPQSPNELVRYDNRPAEKALPKAMAERFARKALYVQSAEPSPWQRSPIGKGIWQANLPPGGREGLPCSTEKPERPSGRASSSPTELLEPSCPAHVDLTIHPKHSERSADAFIPSEGHSQQLVVGVYGNDDRKVYYPWGWPWHCIGRIFNQSGDFLNDGAAVLIGPRLILTARHLLRGSPDRTIRFVPAYYDGRSLLGAGVESWVSNVVWYDTGFWPSVGPWDFGLARLYEPLGDQLGYFGAKTFASSWVGGAYWSIAGYPHLITAERPSYQTGVAVEAVGVDRTAMELKHYGDCTFGNSGGPFFGWWDGVPYVTGVISGHRVSTGGGKPDEDTNIAAGGQAMLDLILKYRQLWG